jgi:broad-specificity NMP kinase
MMCKAACVKQVILVGTPGTGKNYLANKVKDLKINEESF